jgi:TetR/AcrR family transcriptional repressor of mexJK operon
VHFLTNGYQAATVDGIAAGAGLAKRTVYNLFDSKNSLFAAVVGRATVTAERFVTEHVSTDIGQGSLTEELRAFALAHARTVLAPRVIATRRLLIGESLRFPELAAEYFARVLSAVVDAIAERLRRYDAAGALSVPDPRTAAEHFAYLVLGASLDRALFEHGDPDPDTIARTAVSGADTFLRAYAR